MKDYVVEYRNPKGAVHMLFVGACTSKDEAHRIFWEQKPGAMILKTTVTYEYKEK